VCEDTLRWYSRFGQRERAAEAPAPPGVSVSTWSDFSQSDSYLCRRRGRALAVLARTVTTFIYHKT